MIETELLIIKKIKNHALGNKEEALSLYYLLCDFLKEKYGMLDKNYDENPTKRGKEWLDIHHILEYELDDIATRTKNARFIEKKLQNQTENEVVVVIKSEEFYDNRKKEAIYKKYLNKNRVYIYALDYSIEELKPYNLKEKLVYANKIEHFLLHYLIDSIRGKETFSGGINYLWDDVVALDLYRFDKDYMNKIKTQKEKFYSIMSSEEATTLYKKLIDWKKWDLQKCKRYWFNFRNVKQTSSLYIEDKDKFRGVFGILHYKCNQNV